jgi:hypothetical protein
MNPGISEPLADLCEFLDWNRSMRLESSAAPAGSFHGNKSQLGTVRSRELTRLLSWPSVPDPPVDAPEFGLGFVTGS